MRSNFRKAAEAAGRLWDGRQTDGDGGTRVTDSAPGALILGASSGFGEAAALAFAEAGYDIFGVHLDRRGGLGPPRENRGPLQ